MRLSYHESLRAVTLVTLSEAIHILCFSIPYHTHRNL